MDIDDLLGPVRTPAPRRVRKPNGKVDDLLGPTPRKAHRANGKRKYVPLEVPEIPVPGGIFARRESKGKNLGRTCLICNEEMKHKRGRPPVICRKKSCFRSYRNLYRHDYDRTRA